MVTIVIGNSTCKVSGLTKDQLADLRKKLTYIERTGRWTQQVVKDSNGGTKIDPKTRKPVRRSVPEILKHPLITLKGDFPTGLLYIVEDFLKKQSVPFRQDDQRIQPELNYYKWERVVTNRKYAPYPAQVGAAAAALEYGRGIVVGPTGVGKSVIAAEIIDLFRVKTLVVVPSLELKRQLTEGLREYFGRKEVGPLFKDQPKHLVTVENVDALDPEIELKGIDLVIVDEFHHSGAKTYRDLNRKSWKSIYYKIGMTATPFRSQDDERLLLESVLSQVIYRIEYQYAVDNGYIVPMEAYYVELPAKKLRCSGKDFQAVYKELIVEREDRSKTIARMGKNLEEAGISALILTKQVNHGLAIQQFMGDLGADVPFVKGENDDNREVIQAFNAREHNVMIGTNGILGEGVDTKPCEYVIIAGLGKSKNAFMQQVGRGFRKFGDKTSCKIVLVYDPSHKWTIEHFEAQKKYLMDEYGISPEKLDI